MRAAAAELDYISLTDALRVLELIAEQEPQTYDRAAARWLGRLLVERRLTLMDAAAALAALHEMVDRPPPAVALRRLAE